MKQAWQKSVEEELAEQRKGPKRAVKCRLKVQPHILEYTFRFSSVPGSNDNTASTPGFLRLATFPAVHFARPIRLICRKNPGSRSLRDECFASLFLAETVSLTLGELGSLKTLRPELRCCKYAASTRPFVVCLSVIESAFLISTNNFFIFDEHSLLFNNSSISQIFARMSIAN